MVFISHSSCEAIGETNGATTTLATLRAGDYFGEMALLSDKSRNATIQARTAMEVLPIPKADFDTLRKSVPAFGEVFHELARKRGDAAQDADSERD